MKTLKQRVDDQWKRLGDLHTRWDDDRDLVNLAEYTLKSSEGKAVPFSKSVTLNDAALFAANVEAALIAAQEQAICETEDETIDKEEIQDVVKGLRDQADENLAIQGRFEVRPVINQYMCLRGRGAAKCALQIIDGKLDVDIIPWDPRFMTWEMDRKGLALASLRTTRTPDQVMAEYPNIRLTEDKEVEALDILGRDRFELWLDNKLVLEQKNPWGYVPVVIEVVPMGSMLMDKEVMHLQGESIFFMCRDLIPPLNELVSLIRTLDLKQLEAGINIISKEGAGAETKEYKDATAPGAVVPSEQALQRVPYGVLVEQAWHYYAMLQTRLEKATINSFDMGTFTQPMSAVALLTIGEGRDQVKLPRLASGGRLAEGLARMMIDQLKKTGERSIEVGTRNGETAFKIDMGKFEGEYKIVYKYFIKAPQLDAARYTLGQASGLPRLIVWRDIYQVQDLDEYDKYYRWEQAEQLSPAIRMFRTALRLAGEDVGPDLHTKQEGNLLALEMGVTLQQLMRGEMAQTPKPETPPKPMMPLITGQGRMTSAQRSAEIQRTPTERE